MAIIGNIIFPKQTDDYKDISIKIFLKLILIIILSAITTKSIVSLFITTLPTTETLINDLNLYQKILAVVILAPILEEVSFRLWLRKGKYNFQLGLIGALIFFCIAIYNLLNSSIISLPVMFTLIILLTSIILSKFKPIFFQKYYKYFTYASFIAFGFMHIANYPDLESIHYSLYPIMALPYISLGAILGYTRISYGIRYSILLHASMNLLPVLIM